jgi:hypothetical protein
MSLTFKKHPSTISELEDAVQNGLEQLRSLPFNEAIAQSLSFLVPKGYRPIVQFEEDGRKKRSTAAASNWSPETGEILIYFEPEESAGKVTTQTKSPLPPPNNTALAYVDSQPAEATVEGEDSGVVAVQIRECCDALADAERAGKAFVALKWFRDEALPGHGFAWTGSTEERQRVLARAIESGAISTRKIPNPRFPQHPTTTISLNRAEAPRGLTPRFNPILVKGELVSTTIMNDRGAI